MEVEAGGGTEDSRRADTTAGGDGQPLKASLVKRLSRGLKNSPPLVAREQSGLARCAVDSQTSDACLGEEDGVLAGRRQVDLLPLAGLEEGERGDDDAWRGRTDEAGDGQR